MAQLSSRSDISKNTFTIIHIHSLLSLNRMLALEDKGEHFRVKEWEMS